MLSQFAKIAVPCVAVLALGCEGPGDVDFVGTGAVETEPVWVLPYDGYVSNVFTESTTGDTLVIDDQGLSRLDADGRTLFREGSNFAFTFAAAAFQANGNAVVAAWCSGPAEFAGATLCADLDPLVANTTLLLVEIDRQGRAVRDATFGSGGTATGHTLAIGDDGRVHVGGIFSGTLDFGDGEMSTATQSVFYLQLDADWNVLRSRNFGADSGSVSAIAVDPAHGDLFMVGTFAGIARFDGINLTSGPNGNAIFLVRMSPDGAPRWAKHFLGSGNLRARFDGDGLLVYGRGDAPYTSLGGPNVIDGPFATRLGATGEHQWTWREHDEQGTGMATVDAQGRIVASYTKSTLVRPEVVPSEDCYNNYDFGDPDCEYRPAEYLHQRLLRVMSSDGTVLGGRSLGRSEYGYAPSTLAMAADGSVIVAAGQDGDGIDFGTGPMFSTTVLAKVRLTTP